MMSLADIPREALDIRHNSSGVLPHVGLHRRGGFYYQESSYSHFWFAAAMLVVAALVLMLPWEARAIVGKLKYWVIAGCILGAICGFVPYFIRNSYGQVITIDPKIKSLWIARSNFREKVSWEQIVGLQICHQKFPEDSEIDGFQLNLVWADAGGKVRRHCLFKHALRAYVIRLGKRYESLFAFPLIDHTV